MQSSNGNLILLARRSNFVKRAVRGGLTTQNITSMDTCQVVMGCRVLVALSRHQPTQVEQAQYHMECSVTGAYGSAQ